MAAIRQLLLRVLWPLGPWQLITFVTCNLLSFANYSLFHALAAVAPPFSCRVLPSASHSCLRRASLQNASLVPCQEGWNFGTAQFAWTFPQQFGLVCSRHFLVPTTAAMYFTGTIVGRLVGGVAADHFGRLIVFVLASILSCASGVAIAFAPEVVTFALLRFVVGATSNAAIVASVVLWTEISGAKARATFCFVFGVAKACVVPLWTAGLAFVTQDWRWLHLGLSLPAGLALFLPLFLVESPLWLLSRGRKTEMVEAVERAMRLNRCEQRCSPEDIDELRSVLKKEAELEKEQEEKEKEEEVGRKLYGVQDY